MIHVDDALNKDDNISISVAQTQIMDGQMEEVSYRAVAKWSWKLLFKIIPLYLEAAQIYTFSPRKFDVIYSITDKPTEQVSYRIDLSSFVNIYKKNQPNHQPTPKVLANPRSDKFLLFEYLLIGPG